MADKPRLKYEKPVSIDMGRVAPILGDRCSVGAGAADCSVGSDNTNVPSCNVGGTANRYCDAHGLSAGLTCAVGDTAGSCFTGAVT